MIKVVDVYKDMQKKSNAETNWSFIGINFCYKFKKLELGILKLFLFCKIPS